MTLLRHATLALFAAGLLIAAAPADAKTTHHSAHHVASHKSAKKAKPATPEAAAPADPAKP